MADLNRMRRVFLVAVYKATDNIGSTGKGYADKREIAETIVRILDMSDKEKKTMRGKQIWRILEGYIEKGYLKKTSNNPVIVSFPEEVEEEIEKYADAYLNLINAIKQNSNVKF